MRFCLIGYERNDHIKKQLKIFLVGNVDFPGGSAGSAHVGLIVKGLRKHGVQASLVIPYGHSRWDLANSVRFSGHHGGVPYIYMDGKTPLSNRSITKVLNHIIGIINTILLIHRNTRGGNKLDAIIFTNGPSLLRLFPILTICSLCKIPMFFWEVERRSIALDDYGFKGIVRRAEYKLSENLLPKYAKGYIVISSFLKNYYSTHLKPEKILLSPILVNSNVLLSESVLLNSRILKERYKNRKIIVYSGTYAEKDGVYYLLDAIEHVAENMPEVLFVFTGKSVGNEVEELKRKIRSLGIGENVIFTGFISYDELNSFYLAADLLLACRTNSPYANNGFPWKLGEYCMIGNPVLVTRVGDIELYFEDKKNIFIAEPENSNDIAEKILQIMNDSQTAQLIAKLGKEKAIENFDYMYQAKRLKEFVENNIKQ
jgi:glycosyltransferase involved in cell wall biosynthesis